MQYVVIIAQKRSYFLSCLTKEKNRSLRPKKALNFSSFEKQKEYNLALIRTTYQREDGYKKKHITTTNERNKA